MNNLILISIPFVAFWFTNITGIPQAFRRAFNKQSLKPFDCVKCASFWIMLVYELYMGFDLMSIVKCCISSLLGYLIYVAFKKLNIPVND